MKDIVSFLHKKIQKDLGGARVTSRWLKSRMEKEKNERKEVETRDRNLYHRLPGEGSISEEAEI